MSELKKDKKELLACLDEWIKYIKKHLGIDSHSFKAYQQIYQIIQNQSEITKDWIEEKAKKLASMIIDYMPYGPKSGEPFEISELQDFIRSLVEGIPVIGDDWLPTAENINALPEPVRKYIADLETNAGPPSMVQENALLRDTCKALEIKLEEKSAVDEGFVNTWANDFATATLADKTMHKRIIYMLKEIDVEVVGK